MKQERIKSNYLTNESREKACKQWNAEDLLYQLTLKCRARLLKKLPKWDLMNSISVLIAERLTQW